MAAAMSIRFRSIILSRTVLTGKPFCTGVRCVDQGRHSPATVWLSSLETDSRQGPSGYQSLLLQANACHLLFAVRREIGRAADVGRGT